MKSIMFTRDNAIRFWTHNKVTTIRRAGKTNEPRFSIGEVASLRIWIGGAYRSKQFEFGTAVVSGVDSITIHDDVVNLICSKGLRYRLAHLDDSGLAVLAQQDGFDSWSELKTALNSHHGLQLQGFRYCFSDIVLDHVIEADS